MMGERRRWRKDDKEKSLLAPLKSIIHIRSYWFCLWIRPPPNCVSSVLENKLWAVYQMETKDLNVWSHAHHWALYIWWHDICKYSEFMENILIKWTFHFLRKFQVPTSIKEGEEEEEVPVISRRVFLIVHSYKCNCSTGSLNTAKRFSV